MRSGMNQYIKKMFTKNTKPQVPSSVCLRRLLKCFCAGRVGLRGARGGRVHDGQRSLGPHQGQGGQQAPSQGNWPDGYVYRLGRSSELGTVALDWMAFCFQNIEIL